MKKIGIIILGIVGLLGCSRGAAQQGELVIHPVPLGIYYAQHNDDFTVRVRTEGGQWQDLYEYKVKVNMDQPSEASMVYFDFEGTVELMVKKNNAQAHMAEIRPLSKGIRSRLKGNILTFKISEPCNLSVEFDKDTRHNLHIFANPLEKESVDLPENAEKIAESGVYSSPGLLYFAEGVHSPAEEAEGWEIPSNTHVYLAPGSVVKGSLICDHAENIQIDGRGLLWTPQRGVEISYSSNVSVSDVIFVDPRHYTVLGGQSSDIQISNIRSFSYQGWADGIDMMSCSNVHVDGVFMRNSDDCLAIYGPRWDYRGDSRNILVENSVLWADVAHPTYIGLHGYPDDGGATIENVVIKNIDVLEHDEDDPPYEGCFAINCSDLNLVTNVKYENIRVERVEEGKIFHFEVVWNAKYCTAPGRGIQNILVENVSVANIPDLHISSIKGYDAEHIVSGVTFKNVRIGGRRVKSLNEFDTNEFIEKISFE